MASSPSLKRTRGPNKRPPWKRRPEDGLSVLRLALDVSDPVQRARVEVMFDRAFSVRRAVQRAGRKRARAYWAASRERARDPAATRLRLGLSRAAFEAHGRAQLNEAPHLRRAITKAQAMHLADSVWTAMERNLFRDASGKTHGMPRPSRWFDFTRLPGRARSHTKDRKWETFRLHGSLTAHRAAYTAADGRLSQPRRMRPIRACSSWWSYDGPLALVFSGLPIGTLVLPVRLPSAPSNQPVLDHHLGDPSRWHKIDLVRSRDPNAVGGWRYEAHLAVLVDPYVSPSVRAGREVTVIDTVGRHAGIDVNVSNLTVASHADGKDLKITRIARDATQRTRDRSRAKRDRRRQRELDRSRRAMNRGQYQLSKRQQKRERRRAAAGLRPVEAIPTGPRKTSANGKPAQAYRRDALSARYRHERAAQAADAAAATQARRDAARRIAGELVRAHGTSFVVEDCDVSTEPALGQVARRIRAVDACHRTRARGSGRGSDRRRDRWRPARVAPHDRFVAALPVRHAGLEVTRRPRARLPGVWSRRRSRRDRSRTRRARRARCTRPTVVGARRLHGVPQHARQIAHAHRASRHAGFSVSGAARRPVRVNRMFRP